MRTGQLATVAAWAALVAWVVKAVALLALISLMQAVARAALPDSAGWVTEEAGLWLSAAVLGALAQWRFSRTPLQEQTT